MFAPCWCSDVAEAWLKAKGAPFTDQDIPVIMTRLEPLMRKAAEEASELIPGAVETARALKAAGLRSPRPPDIPAT